ncbi:MAG: response regulator [Acidobacteriota bacterium]|nr:response regulator [Acidobacteriota bacterium]
MQCLEFLDHLAEFVKAPRLVLVLVDLNFPKMTGAEVLAEIQVNPLLRDIPVAVFSSSSLDEDRSICLALGTANVIDKRDGFNELEAFLAVHCRRRLEREQLSYA